MASGGQANGFLPLPLRRMRQLQTFLPPVDSPACRVFKEASGSLAASRISPSAVFFSRLSANTVFLRFSLLATGAMKSTINFLLGHREG